ncbi:MAG: hypothetical protein ABI555_05870 [Chloroflexota bacterium]
MDGVSGREHARPDDRRGATHILEFHRVDLVDDAEQGLGTGFNRISSVDGDIPMEDLLEYLGVGHKLLPRLDAASSADLAACLLSERQA